MCVVHDCACALYMTVIECTMYFSIILIHLYCMLRFSNGDDSYTPFLDGSGEHGEQHSLRADQEGAEQESRSLWVPRHLHSTGQ